MVPKRKSFVWSYFTKSIDNKYVTCQECKKKLKYFGNTTNLKQHIQRIHTVLYHNEPSVLINHYRDVKVQQQQPTEPSMQMNAKHSSSENIPTASSLVVAPNFSPNESEIEIKYNPATERNSQYAEVDHALIKMIVSDYQPLSIVENKGFLDYTRKLQPLYKPPSIKTLTSIILPELYTKALLDVKSMLNSVDYVCVTTDVWISDINQSYITIVSHFIHDDKFYNQVLITRELPDPTTSEDIASILASVLSEWNICNKTATVVSNNDPNVKNAICEHLALCYHPCVADTLNICVNETLNTHPQVCELIDKCHKIVSYIKNNLTAADTLKEVQQQMRVPILKIKKDLGTNWNSCLIMMERLLDMKEPLSVTMTNLPEAPECFTNTQWTLLSDCIVLLKPVESMITELSVTKYPSLSLMIPLIRGLQFEIKNNNFQTSIGLLLQAALLETIETRLGNLEVNKVASMATFLDPRLKKAAFSTEEHASNAEKWVTDNLVEIFNENNSISNAVVKREKKRSDSLWSHFDLKISQATTNTTESKAAASIKQYLDMPHLDRIQFPETFWREYKNSFPELYKLQKKYLCIPGTAVPFERLFSKEGQLVNLRRSRLAPKYLDKIIFLNSHI